MWNGALIIDWLITSTTYFAETVGVQPGFHTETAPQEFTSVAPPAHYDNPAMVGIGGGGHTEMAGIGIGGGGHTEMMGIGIGGGGHTEDNSQGIQGAA